MKKIAAIFDVDGTLIAGNITHYYQFYLKHYLSGWKRWIRLSAFYARFPYWGILDQINRSQFNISFY
ncbi:MAG: HAD family hydrolase, partial [Deltaproteobacteria bacterium]|nr:HAD family hydrolase [Deltaproteobacteria bacterium]